MSNENFLEPDEEEEELYEEEIIEAPPELLELRDRINKKIENIEKKEKGNSVVVKGYRLPPSEYQIFVKEWERMKKAGEIPEDCKPNIGSLPVEEDEKIKDLTIVYSAFPREVKVKPYVKKPYHRYYPL